MDKSYYFSPLSLELLVRSQEDVRTILPESDGLEKSSEKDLLYIIYDLVKDGFLSPDSCGTGFEIEDDLKIIIGIIRSPKKYYSIFDRVSDTLIYVYQNDSGIVLAESTDNRKDRFKVYISDYKGFFKALLKSMSLAESGKTNRKESFNRETDIELKSGSEVEEILEKEEIAENRAFFSSSPDVIGLFNCFFGEGLRSRYQFVIYRFESDIKLASVDSAHKVSFQKMGVARALETINAVTEELK